MTNKKIIENVKKYQSHPFFHSLTCGKGCSCGGLTPVEEEKLVSLICDDCGYRQVHIPEFLLREDFEIDNVSQFIL